MNRKITIYSKGFGVQAQGDIAILIALAVAFLLICHGVKLLASVHS